MTSTQVVALVITMLFGGGLVLFGWRRDRHVRPLRRVYYRLARELETASRDGDSERAEELRAALAIAGETYIRALLYRR